MSAWSCVARLCAAYLALFAGWNMAASYLGIAGGNWADTGIVLATAYVLFTQFAEKNRRYFSRREKVIVIAGFVLFDVLLWIARTVIALSAMARDQGGAAFVSHGAIIFSAIFILGFHLIALFAAMAIVERRLQATGVVGGQP